MTTVVGLGSRRAIVVATLYACNCLHHEVTLLGIYTMEFDLRTYMIIDWTQTTPFADPALIMNGKSFLSQEFQTIDGTQHPSQ